ncbi:hypothetical protein EV181_007725, partial [Coemansia sp. RSA 532]
LFVPTSKLPGVLSIIHDDGMAKRAAFRMFYSWRRGLTDKVVERKADLPVTEDAVMKRADERVLAEPDEDVSQGVDQLSLSEPDSVTPSKSDNAELSELDDVATADIDEVTELQDKTKSHLQIPQKRALSDAESSDGDMSATPIVIDDEDAISLPDSEIEEVKVPTGTKTGRTPKRGRRNIKNIRGEDTAVLQMRQQQEKL